MKCCEYSHRPRREEEQNKFFKQEGDIDVFCRYLAGPEQGACTIKLFAAVIYALTFCILSSTVHTFFTLKIMLKYFPAHYTWKVAEKGFVMAFMMNKLAMITSCEIILEK
jgi:hypothetical protein